MKKIVLAAILFSGLCTGITSCKKSSEPTAGSPTSSTTTTTTTTGTGTTTTTTAKSAILGLVAQGSANSSDSTWVPDNTFPEVNAHPNVYVATVIRVQWKQLEPQ